MKRIEISQIRKGNKFIKTNSSGARLYVMSKITIPSRYHEFDVETSAPVLFFTWYNHRSGVMSELKQFPELAKQLVFAREGYDDIREINDNYDVALIISRRAEIMITKSIEFLHNPIDERGFAIRMAYEPEERDIVAGQFLEKYIASVPEIIRDIETACYQFRFRGVQKEMVLEMLESKINFKIWVKTISEKAADKMSSLFAAPVKIKIAKHEQVLEFDAIEQMQTDNSYNELIQSNEPFALHLIVFGNNNPLNWLRVTILPRPQQQLFKPESEFPLLILDYSPNLADNDFNGNASQLKSDIENEFNLAPFDEAKIFPQFTEEDVT